MGAAVLALVGWKKKKAGNLHLSYPFYLTIWAVLDSIVLATNTALICFSSVTEQDLHIPVGEIVLIAAFDRWKKKKTTGISDNMDDYRKGAGKKKGWEYNTIFDPKVALWECFVLNNGLIVSQ